VKSPLKSIVDTWAKKTKERTSAPDIALFGRMLADKPITNIDAACQVAHAFSTHEVRKMDDDFFSAVEDLRRPEDGDEAGAAMIGNLYFTSACFYRYARLDWTQLKKNLGDDDLARKTVRAFLLASEAATPTGMGNSHDNNSRPAFMLAVARVERSASWSLANAFEKPVSPSSSGFIEPSIEQLDKFWNGYRQFYGDDTVKAVAVAMHPALSANLSDDTRAALKPSLAQWVEAILDALPPKE
jgi:CRISPR system Cascade subunit CasC